MQGTKRAYHATSRDWVTNEIFRRVEPKRRTMGEYMQEELVPFFDNYFDVYLGVPDKEYHKCYPFKLKSIIWQILSSFLPENLGKVSNLSFIQLIIVYGKLII